MRLLRLLIKWWNTRRERRKLERRSRMIEEMRQHHKWRA